MAPDDGDTETPMAGQPAAGPSPASDALADAEAAATAAKARADTARVRATELRRKAEAARAQEAQQRAESEVLELPEQPDPSAVSATHDVAPDSAAADEATDFPVAPKPAPRRLPKPRWSLLAAMVGVVALCGLIAASGLLVHAHRETELNRQRNAEYTAAARQGVINIMAINFNTADADVKRVLDSATGDFAEDFQSTSKDLISALKDAKVVTEVSVKGVAVESMTPDTAVVLVAATTQRGNTDAQNRDPRTWRIVVTVARADGQLKISKVDYI